VIVGAEVVQRVIAMMPPGSMESVTLGSRLTGETGYTSVVYANARRVQATEDELAMMSGLSGDEFCPWELYKVDETTDPKVGDKITDSEGVVWQIKSIGIKMQRLIFRCACLKNK
jgi:hypothetical protein